MSNLHPYFSLEINPNGRQLVSFSDTDWMDFSVMTGQGG